MPRHSHQNTFRHQHKKSQKRHRLLRHRPKLFFLQIIFSTFHHSAHRFPIHRRIVTHTFFLQNSIQRKPRQKLFLPPILKIPFHKLQIRPPRTFVPFLHLFPNFRIIKNRHRLRRHPNRYVARRIPPKLPINVNLERIE